METGLALTAKATATASMAITVAMVAATAATHAAAHKARKTGPMRLSEIEVTATAATANTPEPNKTAHAAY